jgi:hypothetical protein
MSFLTQFQKSATSTFELFYWLHKSGPVLVGEDHTRVWTSQCQGHCGPSWRLAIRQDFSNLSSEIISSICQIFFKSLLCLGSSLFIILKSSMCDFMYFIYFCFNMNLLEICLFEKGSFWIFSVSNVWLFYILSPCSFIFPFHFLWVCSVLFLISWV